MIFSQSHSEQFVVINPAITIQKITNAPKNIMCGKSASMELISREMLKMGNTSIYIFKAPAKNCLTLFEIQNIFLLYGMEVFLFLYINLVLTNLTFLIAEVSLFL